MGQPFSARVTSASWLAEVSDWVADVLSREGSRPTGPPEQVRVRPWSTQLVQPTEAGRVWFKANCPGLVHEAALHATLARLLPDDVEAPLAHDADRGWLLTRDRGGTLADGDEPGEDDWCGLVRDAARLQRRLAGAREELLATGLPDCSPATVVERLTGLLEAYASLPSSHPSHLDRDLRRRLEATVPDVTAAARVLATAPVPVTLNHGDLHPGNVFVVGGRRHLFDFGDAQWSAAPEVLGPAWGWLTRRTGHRWEVVLDAWLEEWPELADREAREAVVAAAMTTLPVNRSLTWWLATAEATTDELAEWGDSPRSQLEWLLQPWP